MQLLVYKIMTTFLLGWFRYASPQLMDFVDMQQLILVCNEASDWSTAFGTVSPKGDRTQENFVLCIWKISCVRSPLDKAA